jgi:hypothetical protein
VVGLTKVLQRRDVFAWLFWMQAVLALFTGPLVWADLYSYARVLGLLYLCYGLVPLTTPNRLGASESVRADWTIAVPDWTIFRARWRVPITLLPRRSLSTLKRHEHRT